MIYLDHNSTTPLDPRVAARLAEALAAGYLNPASQHQAGARARRALETAREEIVWPLGGRTTGMESDRLVLTSGGTEANNLALLGLAGDPPGRVLVSAIEHPSIAAAAEELIRRGFTVERIAAEPSGIVSLAHLDELLAWPARLASVMLVNNETGVVQPVAEIARRCHERGVLCHTDAVQAVGKIPVDFAALGVDALTLAPHKYHGPLGIGGLLLRAGLQPRPVLWGGFQQQTLRPGTEPVALTLAFAEATRLATLELQARTARMAGLRDRLESSLEQRLPNIVIHGHSAPRVPNTSLISFPGIDRQGLLIALDLAGLACSTGSACQSGSSEPSPVLLAMGCPEAWTASALRFSLGAFTTAEEIDAAVGLIVPRVLG